MGIMDTPSFASGVMFKIPFYALIFYTFNTGARCSCRSSRATG